jgi:dienelactone hydrolase
VSQRGRNSTAGAFGRRSQGGVAADPLIKAEQIKTYVSAMEASGLDWQMVFYGGAKHSFTNPDADKVGMDALGYNPSADARSWAHMKVFFEELFSK